MLHIVLLILKIIGIVLGILLAVLLAGFGIALFVPVRYRIEARRTEEEGAPPVEAEGSVTWLLHLVNIRFRYPADVYLRARIALFTVFRLPPKQKKQRGDGRRKKNRKSAGTEETQEAGAEEKQNTGTDEGQGTRAEEEQNVGTEEKKSAGAEEKQEAETTEKQQESSPKSSVADRIREAFVRIREIFQNIWYTLTGICDKIKTIWENIEYYMEVIRSDTFQRAFARCRDELISILSYIRPRKFQADLTIGMDDPAATGKILSYYGMLYPLIGGHVNIVPDFERKRIEGTVLIKGKVRLFTFVRAAIRIYFSKDIRKLIRLFKKEDV